MLIWHILSLYYIPRAQEHKTLSLIKNSKGKLDPTELKLVLQDLDTEMKLASANLEFEKAAEIRDLIKELGQA